MPLPKTTTAQKRKTISNKSCYALPNSSSFAPLSRFSFDETQEASPVLSGICLRIHRTQITEQKDAMRLQ